MSVERSAPGAVSPSNRLNVERSAAAATIDDANPWPGLESFTEDLHRLFFGRERETDELARLVRRQTLTVLFGQSGLGKSSLIQAGLFPRLRESDHLPLYIRLDHSLGAARAADWKIENRASSEATFETSKIEDPPALAEQVKAALAAAFARERADAPVPREDETLWEYFHRKDIDIWSAKNRLLTPVLAFDQFEEIFTLGRAGDSARERSQAFLVELACLVENRPPPIVQARLDRGELDPLRFNHDKPSCQVILSLREDFLPELEGLKREMPALIHNRLRLRKLSGTQALDIVTKPAPQLIADGVAEKIVEFVAGGRGGSAERLAELDVEPPLLSVICRELNERRRALGQEQITADLVSGNRREILHDFYERSVADLPEGMRAFVEDHLLTKSGFRDNLALETALEFPGVTRPLIDTLVARRLLRIEDRLGVQRVELTHDVLAEVIRASRDARQQRMAAAETARRVRRQHYVIGGLAAAVVALLIGAFFGLRAQRRAEQLARDKAAESSRTDFVFGSRLLEDDKTPQGLAYLVRAARSDPSNHLVGPRLISALAYRSFAEPIGKPLTSPHKLYYAVYAGDGRHAVTWARSRGQFGQVQYWNLDQAKLLHTFETGSANAWRDRVSDDGRLLAADTPQGAVSVWELATARQLFTVNHQQRLLALGFSPDSRLLLVTSADQGLSIWDAATGELKGTLGERAEYWSSFAVSPDSSRLVTTIGHFRLWKLPNGEPLTPPLLSTRPNSKPGAAAGSWPEFSADGRLFIVGGTEAQIYDGETGAPVVSRLPHGGQGISGTFSNDRTKAATASSDGSARIWEVPSGKLLRTFQHSGDLTSTWFTPDDRYLVAPTGDGLVHVWNIETGRPAVEPIRAGQPMPAAGDGHRQMRRDGREVLTTGRDGVVRRWRLTPGAATPMETPMDTTLLSLQRSDLASTVAWAVRTDRMQQVDLLTGKPIGEPRIFPAPILNGKVSPDGQFLAVRTEAEAAELWTLTSGAFPRRELPVPAGGGAFPCRFSPDSSYLAVSTPAGLQVIDTRKGGAVVGPLPGLAVLTQKTPTPFSPDSRYLLGYSAAASGVSLIDLRTRKVGELLRHAAAFTAIHFTPDSRLMTISPEWGTIGVWDIAANRLIGEPVDVGTMVRGGVLNRSGTRLLTWGRLEMRLWDVASGRQLSEPMTGEVDYDPAILSPDETRAATVATSSGEVRIFDNASGLLLCEPISGADRTNLDVGSFTADGRFFIAARKGGGLLVAPVPPHSSRQVPEWMLRLATGFAGGELDASGKLHERALEPKELDQLRAELAALPDDAPYVEWGRWILADRATRPIGPGLKITAAELARLRQQGAPGTSDPVGPKTSSVD